MPKKLPDCPKILTYSHWNSKKAKLTPETGIGKALKRVEAGLKIDVSNLLSLESLGTEEAKLKMTEPKLDKRLHPAIQLLEKTINGAKKEYKSVESLKKAATDLNILLKEQAKSAKAAKLFPKASRELIEEMIKPSEEFEMKGVMHFSARAGEAIRDAEARLRVLKNKYVEYAKL